jgi:RNA polymerase sigma-70 factor (ECF subfamily)
MVRLEDADDVTLLAEVAARQPAALEVLYVRHAPVLLAILRRVLGSEEEAEDTLQETLLQVWRQAARYDPERASVGTWLVLLARSRAIDRIRARGVRSRTEEEVAQTPVVKLETEVAVGAVLTGERQQRIRAALAELPAPQRRVLEMAYYDGKTQREIAQETGIPLGTVKTRTLLALRKLRDDLRSEVGDLL